MSLDTEKHSEPIESIDQLVEWYRAGIKAPRDRRVGTEHEKLLLAVDGMKPVPYEGGIGTVFDRLVDLGYEPHRDAGRIIGASRDVGFGRESITIEPGGQFELSGAPLVHTSETEAELDRHLDDLRQIVRELDLAAIGTGLNGLHYVTEVPWMPKTRYAIMRDYMPKVGELGHWMMKMTCTVQANFDYTSEADAIDILRTALWISPIVSALFAHSPIWKGVPSGFHTTRCHIWTKTDDDRCGFPLFLLEGQDIGFIDYVQYTLDVPMYFILREGTYQDMTDRTFRQYLEDGYGDHRATMQDYEHHISTLFPEVRMKRYIEVRGADMGGRDQILALPALWKGLLYDGEAREGARRLVSDLTLDQRSRLFTNGVRFGLEGPMPTSAGPAPTIAEAARELVALADAGLRRLANVESATKGTMATADEGRYLDVLRQRVESGRSESASLLARWRELEGDTQRWMLEQRLCLGD